MKYYKISIKLKGFWFAKVINCNSGAIARVSKGYKFAFGASDWAMNNFHKPYCDTGMGHKYNGLYPLPA